MELIGDVGQVALVSISFKILLISTQDRCILCARCAIGSKISLDATDGILGDIGQVEDRLSLFGDSVNHDAR